MLENGMVLQRISYNCAKKRSVFGGPFFADRLGLFGEYDSFNLGAFSGGDFYEVYAIGQR